MSLCQQSQVASQLVGFGVEESISESAVIFSAHGKEPFALSIPPINDDHNDLHAHELCRWLIYCSLSFCVSRPPQHTVKSSPTYVDLQSSFSSFTGFSIAVYRHHVCMHVDNCCAIIQNVYLKVNSISNKFNYESMN